MFELDLEEIKTDYNKRKEALQMEPRGVESLDAWEYLPISIVENLLDSFFESWSTNNFKYEIIGNEIVGSIILETRFKGITKQLTGTGGASVPCLPIPANVEATDEAKNAFFKDPTNAKAGELGKTLSIVKALCVKNASKGLGTIFGRDLNRDLKGYLTTFEKHADGLKNDIRDLRNEVSFKLEEVNDENINANVLEQLLQKDESGELTVEFLRKKIKELNELIEAK